MIDTVTLLIELSQNVVLLLALIFTYGFHI